MRALVTIEYYDGKRIRRGDTFAARSEDVRILELLDKARLTGPPVPPAEDRPEAETRPKRRYRRRDLTAEP